MPSFFLRENNHVKAHRSVDEMLMPRAVRAFNVRANKNKTFLDIDFMVSNEEIAEQCEVRIEFSHQTLLPPQNHLRLGGIVLDH